MSQGNVYIGNIIHILESRTNSSEDMCEPPIKEDMFTGFTGEMENDKTEGKLVCHEWRLLEVVSFVLLIKNLCRDYSH